jgi:uncharacterized protein (DUF302 family)
MTEQFPPDSNPSRFDHASAAANVGPGLRPTEVLLFGNPKQGTPLMQAVQTIGIDLPLGALIWQDEAGKTWLSYNDPRRLHAVTVRSPARNNLSPP